MTAFLSESICHVWEREGKMFYLQKAKDLVRCNGKPAKLFIVIWSNMMKLNLQDPTSKCNTSLSPLILPRRMFAECMVDLQAANGWDAHVKRCFLCCWKRVFSTISAFSWKNSVSLCPASFCTPRQNLPMTPGLLISYPCTPVPYNEKDISLEC